MLHLDKLIYKSKKSKMNIKQNIQLKTLKTMYKQKIYIK